MVERKILHKAISEVFKDELQALNSDLQSMLMEDLITAFYNRLNITKKILQHGKSQSYKDNSLVLEHKQVLDPDTLQLEDETNKKWVEEWKKAVSKLVSQK